jgi:DNA (cytosine-5)-methyltransferase 1
MSNFSALRQEASLTLEDAGKLLKLSVETVAEYERGTRVPASREIQILKGLSLGHVTRLAKQASSGPTAICSDSGGEMRKLAKKKSAAKLTSLELCAGGGGAALGLEAAGFTPSALIELDPHACATLRRNRPYWNVIQADIRRFEAEYWRGVDLVSGGLPCPPFSIAGKQLGPDDERDLFPAMLKIVKAAQPRALLIENVRGILTDRFSGYRERIDSSLKKLGFDPYWAAFNAADFGVPQNRFRVFLVALRRGETKELKWPFEFNSKPVSVATAIGDLMQERGWAGAEAWKAQANLPAPTIVGGSHKHGGPDLGPTRARKEWAALGVDGLGLADAPPAPDFEGKPRLTVRMVARLQSFPDDWQFIGGKTHSYRQVGNALPVGLAANVAKAVRECLI